MTSSSKVKKPDLLNILDKSESDINFAFIIPNEDIVIVLAEDRSVRIYIKRETGGYWPAVFHYLPSPGTCLQYCNITKHIFIGCDNGTVMEFEMKDDFNAIVHKRDYLSHVSRVTGLIISQKSKWLLSCSKDKLFAIYSAETGSCIDGFQLQSQCTCIKYDEEAKYVFVGDSSGRISFLDVRRCSEIGKPGRSGTELVKNLNGHSDQAIRSLDWDAKHKKLISCGDDNLIIVWDIGGNKGEAIELLGNSGETSNVDGELDLCERKFGPMRVESFEEGHFKPVTNVISLELFSNNKMSKSNNVIISTSLDESVIFWNMDADRQQSPSWSSSNNCDVCGVPFFWNWKKMWEDKKVGGRQHHCRKCGKAVCDNCSPHLSRFPPMGFEIQVRMCADCKNNIKESEMTPLINAFDSKHPITSMFFEFSRHLLVTVGKDRLIKLWNVKSLLE